MLISSMRFMSNVITTLLFIIIQFNAICHSLYDHIFYHCHQCQFYDYPIAYDTMIICNIQMQVQNQADNDHDSFYSIDNSRSEFTFVQEPLPEQTDQIMHPFDIRQSSALELSSNLLNKSIASQEPLALDDISVIHQQQGNEMQCSMCLQKQIDSLTLPNQPTQEELKALQENIFRLRKDQSLLKQQIQIFQGLMEITKSSSQTINKNLLQANRFVKKSCEHSTSSALFNIPWADPNQLVFKQLPQPQIQKIQQEHKQQHFDIKPSKTRSLAQKQANFIYKRASLQKNIILFDDSQNKYRIELQYETQHLKLSVMNYQKGETNFTYAVRINDNIFGSEKISQKFIVPLKNYQPKKFTLTISVMILIFKNGKQKDEKNLLQAEEVRSLSLPLPINYFICPRFVNGGIPPDVMQKIEKKMYFYEIDFNYGVDVLIHKQLNQLQWVQKHWVSLRGSSQLLFVDLGVVKEHQDGFRLVFRVGSKQKDAQQSIDLIQYLCFMLAL